MADSPDELVLSRQQFGENALKLIEGVRAALESVQGGYVTLDRYPPYQPWPPGSNESDPTHRKAAERYGADNALGPVLHELDILRRFTVEIYLERRHDG